MEDDRFVTFPFAVILDAVGRVERDKYRLKCPMSKLRLKLAAAHQDRKQDIAAKIEASHASFHLDLPRVQVMSTKSQSPGKKTKVQGVPTSSNTSAVEVKVEGTQSNAQKGKQQNQRQPIVIVVDDFSDIEPETPPAVTEENVSFTDETESNTDVNEVGSDSPSSTISRTAVQGLLAMTTTFGKNKANATSITTQPKANATSTQQGSHASNALSNDTLAQENYEFIYATGWANAKQIRIFGLKFKFVTREDACAQNSQGNPSKRNCKVWSATCYPRQRRHASK
jgi:hypothetical protein